MLRRPARLGLIWVAVVFAASCAEQHLAPPPRADGPCAPRPQCESESICEYDTVHTCEVCKCQSPIGPRPK